MGRADEAKEAAHKALAVNPLDFWGLHELGLLEANSQPQSFPGNSVQASLELAMDYSEAGLGSEAEQVLRQLVAASPDRNRVNPLIYYDLGYLAMQSGQPGEATRYFHLAAQMPTDYVFPFRLEEVKVLEAAMQANPGDARAPYYLGNLLYDRQPDVAIKDVGKIRRNRQLILAGAQKSRSGLRAIAERLPEGDCLHGKGYGARSGQCPSAV